VSLTCAAHNDLHARTDFGDAHMNRFTRRVEGAPAMAP
jgi:hypothetical protein